jgi:ParB/RepB/Spo0J family partition protein
MSQLPNLPMSPTLYPFGSLVHWHIGSLSAAFGSLVHWHIDSLPLGGAAVSEMPIDAIVVNRNGYSDADLAGLVASIRARGVLHPLVVTPDGRLLAGRRRLEAARRAGLVTVPVRVCAIETERAAIEIGLIENAQRADLDPLTRAQAYRALVEQGATIEEIAELVGQGVSHIYQHLQLLDLHPQVQQALHARAISFADARTLVPLGLEDQVAVLEEIHSSPKPLSSRQVKARVERRRVMQLVKSNVPNEPSEPNVPKVPNKPNVPNEPNDDCYAALFEVETRSRTPSPSDADPLEQLNALIAEMIAAAHGEDHIRAWARRLSHMLETLRAQCACRKASATQERLF